MKKILIVFGLVLFSLSLFAQNYNKKGFREGTPSSYVKVMPNNGSVYDYVISKSGATIYAAPKGTLTAYSGTDVGTVITNAIHALTNGGSIFVTSSVVASTGNEIYAKNRDNIKLIFEKGSLISAEATSDEVSGLKVEFCENWIIDGFTYNGNWTEQVIDYVIDSCDQAGIYIETCKNVLVKNAHLYNGSQYGIYMNERDTVCGIIDSYIHDNIWHGVMVGNNSYAYGCFVLNCHVEYGGDGLIGIFGIYSKVVGNTLKNKQWAVGDVWHNTGTAPNGGISCEGGGLVATNNLIQGNVIRNCNYGSIAVNANCTYNKFFNNQVYGWDIVSDPEEYNVAVYVNSSYNTFSNNFFQKTSGYGYVFALTENADDNVITNNYMEGRGGVTLSNGALYNYIGLNKIKGAIDAILIAAGANYNRVIENDMDLSTDDINDSGTGTIIGNNIWKDGTYDTTPPV